MSTENELSISNLQKCKAVLLDVAGTTTSNIFLRDTLFSYVTKQAEDFLKNSWEEKYVKDAVESLQNDVSDVEEAINLVRALTEKGSENKGLKTIQGLIYKKGYESGELKAHVFPDVPICIEAWAKARRIAIYSTGSIDSQQLLFSHTAEGDLSLHISKYFDQSVGKKTEAASYEQIAKELGVEMKEIIFISDNVKETEAAKSAGLLTAVITREGNDPLLEDVAKDFTIISSFEEVVFDKPEKSKDVDEPVSKKVRSSKSTKV